MTTRVVAVVAAFLASAAALLVLGPGNETAHLEELRSQQAARQEARAELSREANPLNAVTTTSTTVASEQATGDDAILVAVTSALVNPIEGQLATVAAQMAADGDPGWVPFLVDLVRTFGVGETLDALEDALAGLTGVAPPAERRDVFTHYGRWMSAQLPEPRAGYVEWKAQLYGLADPAFTTLLLQVDDPIVAAQLQWGGVGRGGIPELNDPETIAVAAADYMTPDELTFGAVVNGEVRSYPHRILDHHELANDTLGGEPVALVNCTLCRTGVLYSRRVGDLVLDFQTSGLLRNSNKVMVDLQTDTLWNQLTGEAIAGSLAGTVLERFPLTVTTYGAWIEEHPDSGIVAIPTGFPFTYQPGDAYAEYFASADVWYPIAGVPDTFGEKDQVATVDIDGAQLAVGVDALDAGGPQVIELGGRTLVAVGTGGGARIYAAPGPDIDVVTIAAAGEEALILADGSSLPRIQSGQSFWFAWYLNFPDTAVWPG